MKKLTLLLCAVFLSATAFSAFAQNADQADYNVNKLKNNWFISLGGAASMLQGEQDKDLPFSDRLRYSGELSVGKWFNPFFGARLQVLGGSLRGANFQFNHGGELQDRYILSDRSRSNYPIGYNKSKGNWGDIKLTTMNGEPAFFQDFSYAGGAIDLMGNLANLFRGYWGQKNAVDIAPFIGAGMIRAASSPTNPVHVGFLGRLGVRANFNLNEKWAIYLEPQVNFASSELDGYEGNRICDMFGNVFVGIQYTIKRDFTTPATLLSMDEINYINDRINENRGLIENQQDILERQQNLIERLDGRVNHLETTCQSTAATMISENGFLPDYIRFSLNSTKIPNSEFKKIQEAAAYLKVNPDSKLLLIGYADRQTGNKTINLDISHSRAIAVSDALQQMGISPKRIILEWKGDKEQPFTQNDWNRVVILVERK